MNYDQEIEGFIEQWRESPDGCRSVFRSLYHFLAGLEGAQTEFHARPGITYSLRGIPVKDSAFPLFVMIDVIEDQPRWLSVCFYEKMVNDYEGLGDSVPGGLLGEDGLCFDIESEDAGLNDYLKQRIAEACAAVVS